MQIKDIKDVEKLAAAIAKHDSWYDYSTYWQFRTGNTLWDSDPNFEWHNSSYDLSKYSEWNSLTDDEKEIVKWLLSYTVDPASLPKSWKDNWASTKRILAAATAIGRDFWWTQQKYKTTQNVRNLWEKSQQAWWEASRNSTAMSVLKSIAESYDTLNNTDFTYVNNLVNRMKKQNWDTDTIALDADIVIAASEMAWALKGNASPTEQEIQTMKELLSWNLSYNQALSVIKKSAKWLFDKNESEAMWYYNALWEKPKPIWVSDVADWMYNDLWINVGRYYDYKAVSADELREKYFPESKSAYQFTWGALDLTWTALDILNS